MSSERLLMPIGEAMFHAMFEVPTDVSFHFCIPLGYPAVKSGASPRKPIAETAYLDRWGSTVSW